MLNLIAPQTTPAPSLDTGNVESQPTLSRRIYRYSSDSDDDSRKSNAPLLIGIMIPVAAVIISVIVVTIVKTRKEDGRKAPILARGGLPLNNPSNRGQRTNINPPRRPSTPTIPPYTPGNTTTRTAPPTAAQIAVCAAQAVPADPGQTTTRTAPPLVPMIMVPAPTYTPDPTTAAATDTDTTSRPETPADTTTSPMRSTSALLPTRTSSPRPSSDTASTSPSDITIPMATSSRTTTRTAPPPAPDRIGTPPPPYSRDPV